MDKKNLKAFRKTFKMTNDNPIKTKKKKRKKKLKT